MVTSGTCRTCLTETTSLFNGFSPLIFIHRKSDRTYELGYTSFGIDGLSFYLQPVSFPFRLREFPNFSLRFKGVLILIWTSTVYILRLCGYRQGVQRREQKKRVSLNKGEERGGKDVESWWDIHFIYCYFFCFSDREYE